MKVEIPTFFLLYLGMVLFFFLLLWFFSHLKSRKKVDYHPPSKLAICEYCHHPYLAPTEDAINRCPLCHSLNKENFYIKKT